jgi:hypothetical protein
MNILLAMLGAACIALIPDFGLAPSVHEPVVKSLSHVLGSYAADVWAFTLIIVGVLLMGIAVDRGTYHIRFPKGHKPVQG